MPRYMGNTVRGFSPWEVVSALQKSIRRGDEKQAVCWAVEMDQSGHSSWLWNRLHVITSEDVGLAWVEGPSVIRALHATWKEQKAYNRDSHPERLFVIHAVLALCKASKSRLVDEATCATYGVGEPLVEKIPDYAFDMHTAKGKRMGRGIEHWEKEASLLENPADIPSEVDWWSREKELYSEEWAGKQAKEQRVPETICLDCGSVSNRPAGGLF